MFKKLSVILLVLVLVFSLTLAGCTKDQPTDNPTQQQTDKDASEDTSKSEEEQKETSKDDKYGGVVRRAIWSSPPGVLHPSLYEDTYDAAIISLIYDSMVTMNPNLEYEPAMAERWEVSDDSKTVTFYLREGLKWHDGKPVTAEDVKFTFEFIAHPDYTGPRYSDITAIVGVEEFHEGKADDISGIKIIDERTISFTTKDVYAPFMSDIGARAIIPKHIWEKVPVGEASKATELLRNPIGSGPFKMKEFAPDQYCELVAFEDYWDGRPYLDGFIIQVANQETSLAQMANLEIDFMDISSLNDDDVKFLEDNGVVVQEIVSNGYQYMGLNNRLDIFKDKRVHQAFAYAINRQAIVDNLLEGHGTVANVPLPPTSWAVPKTGINKYEYNPQKAIELLKEAGWEYKDGKMYRNGKPVKLTLKYPTGNKVREKSAPLIQQNLADIGIEVELMIMEFDTLATQVFDEHDFEMYLMGWGLTPDPDARGIWGSDLVGKGGWNAVGFVNKKSDELLEKGVKYLEIEKRKPIYQEWAKLMNEELPAIFLYHQNEGRALNPKLKGTQIFTFGDYYQVHKWYYEK
ncbi:peptide-binding protein [Caloranaerobacter sp. DY30410]|uniref:peptide-binding protein n=1 Tax=Caloranaerobacter sp. DY30410 TaxID=3238305 RepID=UPI003CFF26C9